MVQANHGQNYTLGKVPDLIPARPAVTSTSCQGCLSTGSLTATNGSCFLSNVNKIDIQQHGLCVDMLAVSDCLFQLPSKLRPKASMLIQFRPGYQIQLMKSWFIAGLAHPRMSLCIFSARLVLICASGGIGKQKCCKK